MSGYWCWLSAETLAGTIGPDKLSIAPLYAWGFLTIWWLSSKGKNLERESARWKPYCLMGSSFRNHTALLPPHSICQDNINNKVLPRFKGRKSRLYLLVGEFSKVLEEFVGLEILLWTFSENTVYHTLLFVCFIFFFPASYWNNQGL